MSIPSSTNAKLPGGRWIAVDLHVHSVYSGGSLGPTEILKVAQTGLLDAIAIADHYETKGAIEGQKLSATDSSLPLTITAQEISAGNHFHFLLIGGGWDALGNFDRNNLVQKLLAHRQAGGVTLLAHPWTVPRANWAMGCLKEVVAEKLIDGIELFNSSILEMNIDHGILLRSILDEWVLPNKLGVVGGSDFHYHHQGRSIGGGRTYLKVFFPGEEGILEALRSRRCVAGLFNPRFFNLGWIGSGHSVLLGAEPWAGELKRFIAEARTELAESWFLKPAVKKYLNRLLEAGAYQLVHDLL